jgi:hydroxypyruvate reductase
MCLVAGGETTVRVLGNGRGGRNQEFALSAARVIAGRSGVLVAGFGTDGVDGPTDAAGAWVTGDSIAAASDLDLDADDYLARNDAYTFHKALGTLLITGPTGTNVNDLMIGLIES